MPIDPVLNDPNRDAFLRAVMDARSLQGVETAMEHYDRLMSQIDRLEKAEAYWRTLAIKRGRQLNNIMQIKTQSIPVK